MKIKVYYSWEDLVEYLQGEEVNTFQWGTFEPNYLDIEELFKYFNMNVGINIPLGLESEFLEFKKLLVAKYFGSGIIVSKDDLFKEKYALPWLTLMAIKLKETSTRYLTLLKAYKDEKDKLLAPITSTTTSSNDGNHKNESKGSDVPADVSNATGGYLDSVHVANINQDQGNHHEENSSTTSYDMSSKMSRINEIENGFKDTISDWVNEFSRLFFEELNGKEVEENEY